MYTFKVEGMSCMNCVRHITEAFQEFDASLKPQVDLKEKTVKIETTQPLEQMASLIEEAGYDVVDKKTT